MLAVVLVAAASLCLLFLMGIVVFDVIVRAIEPTWRIVGMVDYVEFSLAWLIYLAIPTAILGGQLIVVDLIDSYVRPRPFVALGLILTAIATALMGYHTITPALDALDWGDRTLDLGWPKFNYWIAIWVGLALSALAALLTLVTPKAEGT
ncbi:TRAP transporter small permease [Pseudaestuariivita sp.]|uniref:TRAP transporter small permease n=1 Tax=Pseudaestuariivita sp. TaxID=2211669 RepID=UPI0040588175